MGNACCGQTRERRIKMTRLLRIAMVCAVMAAGLAGTAKFAEAALILDQSHGTTLPPPAFGGPIRNNFIDIAQTFTVGLAGVLGRVEVAVSRLVDAAAPLNVEIRSTIGGLPNPLSASVVAEGVLAPADVPNGPQFAFVGVDLLSDNFVVAPGDVLAIVLRSDTLAGGYFWGFTPGDPYGGGHGFFRNHTPGTDPFLVGGGDHFFRTFVAPVAEPVSAALVGLSLVMLAFARLRRDPRMRALRLRSGAGEVQRS
jgi:hypothetical protein